MLAEQERDEFVAKAISDTKDAKKARRRAEQKREAMRRKGEAALLPTEASREATAVVAHEVDDLDDGGALPILEWQP